MPGSVPDMGLFRFYWLVIRTAVRSSASHTQDLLFLAIFVVGGAGWIGPHVGVMTDLTPWLTALGGWNIAAVAFVSVIALRLVMAPYWLWKEEREKEQASIIRIDGLQKIVYSRDKMKNIANQLGEYLIKGRKLLEMCEDESKPFFLEESELWSQEALKYINCELGVSFSSRFTSESGLIAKISGVIRSQERQKIWWDIVIQIERLQEFIKEVGANAR